MFILNYKHICIFIIIVLTLWFLISILRAAMKKRKPVQPPSEPKYYLNTVGNGTRMVIGGFSHPNHLFAMNRVPYDGPI